MLRFICHLLGKPYESCKSCETLKTQLDYERTNNAELLASLLNIAKPTIVEQNVKEIEPIRPKAIPWHKKQQMLEEQKRMEARVLRQRAVDEKNEPSVMKDIENLEKELGIENAR